MRLFLVFSFENGLNIMNSNVRRIEKVFYFMRTENHIRAQVNLLKCLSLVKFLAKEETLNLISIIFSTVKFLTFNI